MGQQSDEVLLKKANYPGRDILGLALLATVVTAVFLIAVTLGSKDSRVFVQPFTLGLLLISASYWLLGVAARRGSRNAVSVLLVILTILVVLEFVGMTLAKNPGRSAGFLPAVRLVIVVLIIAFLARDYKILRELKKRGLWGTAFPVRKSATALCTVGAVLLVAGIVVLNLGVLQTLTRSKQYAEKRQQAGDKFVGMIQNEEATFMRTMKRLPDANDATAYDDAVRDLEALHKRVKTLRNETQGTGGLASVLLTYSAAVEHWKKGIELLLSDNPKAQVHLKKGDDLRQEAAKEFDERFVKPEKTRRKR